MDFTANLRRSKKTIIGDSLIDLYPHDLSLYRDAPAFSISLEEFENAALERVELFRVIEQASLKGHKLYSPDWRNCIVEDLNKAGLKRFHRFIWCGCNGGSDIDLQARRLDHISHFILRIAYCRSEELRRWFLSRELDWFRLKFAMQNSENINKFLHLYNLSYTPISTEEKNEFREELISSTMGNFHFDNTDIYRVNFTEVCTLVKSRRVFLRNGFAYIPAFELIVCILNKFRTDLSETLAIYNRRLPQFDDERVNDLLENLHKIHTGNNYTTREDKESIDPANLEQYSKKHYPLCMRQMHEMLKQDHHLKHQARLTYGFFLKAIGLLYDDALALWRNEFTKKIDSNEFDKKYLYNIKHQYGKVGNMVNYSPYSCIKIISASIGPGEYHGCPFKCWDASVVKQKIIELGVGTENANDIKELVANSHYQIACGKYFEYSHGKAPTNGINHPNQYFEESINLEKGTNK